MKKEILSILLLLLVTFGCNNSNDSGSSSDGDTTNKLQIIALEAKDQLGSSQDNTVQAQFAENVTGLSGQLSGKTFVASYGKRKGMEIFCHSGCIKLDTGAMRLDISNDASGDGFLEAGSEFYLFFANLTDSNADFFIPENIQNLSEWANSAFSITSGFKVTAGNFFPTDDTTYTASFKFETLKNIPITAFDQSGNNTGITVTLPAYTIVDINGVGNVFALLNFFDEYAPESQSEPEGLTFDAFAHHQLFSSHSEDGVIVVNENFRLEFSQPMDEDSTIFAIKFRLEEDSAVWASVDVVALTSTTFEVTVQDSDANLGSSGVYRLELLPWDVTNAEGISNSTQSIIFDITDITIPELTTQLPESAFDPATGNGSSDQFPYDFQTLVQDDTLAIILYEDPLVSRTNNNQLVPGDVMMITFSENFEQDADFQNAMVEALDSAVTGTAVTNAQVSYDNPIVSLQLIAGQTVDLVGDQLQLGNLDSTRINDLIFNTAVDLADNQNPTATKANWMVAPSILDLSTASGASGNGLHVKTISNPEDNTLEAGDTIWVLFNKEMNVTSVKKALGELFANAAINGGSKSGSWGAITAADILATSDLRTGLPNSSFSYTLNGNQTLSISGDSLSFGQIDSTLITDRWGLYLNQFQELNVTKENFDPPGIPSLVGIEGVIKSALPVHCGNKMAEEGDIITFTFSEPLVPSSIVDIQSEIVTMLNQEMTSAGSTSNLLETADIIDSIDSGKQLFIVTLDSDQYFDITNPITFNFSSAIVDFYDHQAIVTQGVLAPFDTLSMTLDFDAEDKDQNLRPFDGLLSGGDNFLLTFNECKMDRFVTLSAIQEATDTMMGNGVAKVLPVSGNYKTFQVEILPGQRFDVSQARTLTVNNIATAVDPSDPNTEFKVINTTFASSIADIKIEDVILTFVEGSASGFTADFMASASLTSGTWYLSDISSGLCRSEKELPFVFSDYNSTP